MTSEKQMTLTHHVPTRSRRGAALSRAKSALSDALDARLNLEIVSQEQRKIELLGEILGLSHSLSRLAGRTWARLRDGLGRSNKRKDVKDEGQEI